jgi:hypothetical protein
VTTTRTAAATTYTRSLGARLLGEANDLKRTAESMADEMGMPLERLRAAMDGLLQPDEYRELFTAIAGRYPIAFGRLWIEPVDTTAGVRHMTAAESESSSRVFTRKDRTGALTPYYEYRDTAMSRLAPFRPEWIRELRVVADPDPEHADVAYNRGHFLHQTTLFIGPVNFYWEANGRKYSAELDTGDSNYITPFWPHSFTSRDASRPAIIIAVTYGGEVARAREELSRMGGDGITGLTLPMRDEAKAYAAVLRRQLLLENMSDSAFADQAARAGLAADRSEALLAARDIPSPQEIAIAAGVLAVTPRDLMPPVRRSDEEVLVLRRRDAATYVWPDPASPCYRVTRLVRSRQQPYLKSVLLEVIPGQRGAELAFGLHQYIFNYRDEAVRLTVHGDDEQEFVLAPGDSAYVMPMVRHSFNAVGSRPGELYIVRVPGDVHADAVFELSGVAPAGLARVAAETNRWF